MVAAAPRSAPPVLVIDDVEDNRDVYDQFLRALQPSVIILDLGLRKMDGWEVARELDAGVDEFCAKPFLPADLIVTIRRHLK